MRLLQVGLRSSLLYSLVIVLISIPVSLLSIREILNEEVDETLAVHAEQFLNRIKMFEYLEDIEMDLKVMDQLSHNIHIKPSVKIIPENYRTVVMYDSIERENRPFRILSSSVNIKDKIYVLTVSMSLVDNDDLIVAIGSVQAAMITLLAAGLILLNRSLSRRLWKPFYKTLNQLKAYQVDKNEAIEMDVTRIIEFDDLNKTVSHLTDRNRKVYLQQKEFIENASHELQTPLAIFQSKLDVLMQRPALTESEATAIQELEMTVQRMARLNKNLLLLSKIDNEQFKESSEIELMGIVRDALANLRAFAESENIQFTTDLQPVRITANRTLIEVLVTNLLHNAVKHATLKRTVHVELKERQLKVLNSGSRLKMEPEKMFERFAKETKTEDSTGLGLAIVKKICDTCAYSLRYKFENDSHIFFVSF